MRNAGGSGRKRLAAARLWADLRAASRQAVVAPEVRRAMARAGYALGISLAVVAALGVHAALRVWL